MNKTRTQLLDEALTQLGYISRTISAPRGFSFDDLVLTRPQVNIFFFVAHRKQGVSAKDIARFLSVTKGAVSQFIDALVEKNLVQREEDTTDRRLQRITLTDFAKKRLDTFEKAYYASLHKLFDRLADQELLQLIALLGKLNASNTQNSC